ncbi:MAG: spore cortex biosynthesis protein YabQ [Clostridia bacterium]|nr:spore cortex biosynthesis protein YabQ [Clostridia bacterium]
MSGLDLYATQGALARMFVYAAVAGFLLGGVYDAMRLLRAFLGGQSRETGREDPRPLRVLGFFEDVCFMVTASVTLLVLGYYTNDGQLRAPAVVGMACGFFVYRYTLGVLTKRLTRPLTVGVRRLVRLVLAPVRVPLLWLGRGTVKGWRSVHHRMTEARTRRKAHKNCSDFPESTADLPSENGTEPA